MSVKKININSRGGNSNAWFHHQRSGMDYPSNVSRIPIDIPKIDHQ